MVSTKQPPRTERLMPERDQKRSIFDGRPATPRQRRVMLGIGLTYAVVAIVVSVIVAAVTHHFLNFVYTMFAFGGLSFCFSVGFGVVAIFKWSRRPDR